MGIKTKFKCPRCLADPQPVHFGSPRNCAFNEDGTFTQENWRCGTMDKLLSFTREHDGNLDGCDESMQIIDGPSDSGDPNDEICGFIVMARYKHRGRTMAAKYIGHFGEAEFLFTLAEKTIKFHEGRKA
jgi:hypothetical protein